jgi:putative Mg2+ transporter-C (MgtC) family protein
MVYGRLEPGTRAGEVAVLAFPNLPTNDSELLLKALAGLLCGLLIGFERAYRRKPENVHPGAIIRTLAFIGLSCSLAVGAFDQPQPEVVAGALTGIGFLGGGIILRNATGDAVTGITTAAGIFFMAAVGAIIGVGRFWTGAIVSIAAFIVLEADALLLAQFEWVTRPGKQFGWFRRKRGSGGLPQSSRVAKVD